MQETASSQRAHVGVTCAPKRVSLVTNDGSSCARNAVAASTTGVVELSSQQVISGRAENSIIAHSVCMTAPELLVARLGAAVGATPCTKGEAVTAFGETHLGRKTQIAKQREFVAEQCE
jgi:hypothetical protein